MGYSSSIALACGYKNAITVEKPDDLDSALSVVRNPDIPAEGPVLLEIRCAMGSRADLGRPTTTAIENKEAFMAELNSRVDK